MNKMELAFTLNGMVFSMCATSLGLKLGLKTHLSRGASAIFTSYADY